MLQEEFSFNPNADLKGIKIAKVVSSEDPKMQERVLVRVLGVHNVNNETFENAIWAHHCSPFRNGAGDLPEIGDFLWGMFANENDFMMFVWFGFVRSSFQDGLDGTKVVAEALTDIFGAEIIGT